jgi:hypothetical protein
MIEKTCKFCNTPFLSNADEIEKQWKEERKKNMNESHKMSVPHFADTHEVCSACY